jgi:hypothetical protein
VGVEVAVEVGWLSTPALGSIICLSAIGNSGLFAR